jgi:hypothetical protein
MIFLIALAVWVAIAALIVGLCLTARLGDQNQEIGSPTPSQPDPHTPRWRRRAVSPPGRDRARRDLSLR